MSAGALNPVRARAVIRQAVIAHLGAAPSRIAPQGGGLSNVVYSVTHPGGDYIAHLGRTQAKLGDFQKERWATTMARRVMPTPTVVAVGVQDGVPFMITRRARGEAATDRCDPKGILIELGRLMAALHRQPGDGFGGTYHPSLGSLRGRSSWAEYLEHDLHSERRLQAMLACGIVSQRQVVIVRRILSPRRSGIRPVLTHGDMRLKNVMVGANGRISAVIDWENCSSNVPEWDLSIALHDLTIDDKEAFMSGYGARADQIAGMAPLMKALNILNYGAVFLQARPLSKKACERLRIRLSGCLDLFSV